MNERFMVHDSLGFEAGDERNIDIVKQFILRRKAMPQPQDQVHAVWYEGPLRCVALLTKRFRLCLEIPYFGGRLLEAGVEQFLKTETTFLAAVRGVLFVATCHLPLCSPPRCGPHQIGFVG